MMKRQWTYIFICLGLITYSCSGGKEGCTDPNSISYDPEAEVSDGSCQYPSETKKVVCFFFTDSDNNTCGTFGIDLLDQVKATGPSNTFFISVHPQSTDTLFAPSGIDVAGAYSVSGFPDFGVGEQSNLLTQGDIINAIDNELLESPKGGVNVTFSTTADSIIVDIYGQIFQEEPGSYFAAAYIVENNVVSPQLGQSPTYTHMHVLRASAGSSGIGQMVSLSGSKTFHVRSAVYRNPNWVMARVSVIGVIWRDTGTDFEFINAEIN